MRASHLVYYSLKYVNLPWPKHWSIYNAIDVPYVQSKLSLYLCDCTLANRNISVSSVGLSTI